MSAISRCLLWTCLLLFFGHTTLAAEAGPRDESVEPCAQLLPQLREALEKRVSLQLAGQDPRGVAELLSRATGAEFLLAEADLPGHVPELKLEFDGTLQEALDRFCPQWGVVWAPTPLGIRIGSVDRFGDLLCRRIGPVEASARDQLSQPVELSFVEEALPLASVLERMRSVSDLCYVAIPAGILKAESEHRARFSFKGALSGGLDRLSALFGLYWRIDERVVVIGGAGKLRSYGRALVEPPPPYMREVLQKEVTLAFNETSLELVLLCLDDTDLRYQLVSDEAPGSEGANPWHLEDVPITLGALCSVQQAVSLICESAGLRWKVEDDMIVIGSAESLNKGLPAPERRRERCILNSARAGIKTRVVDLLQQGAPVDARDENGNTPLLLSSERGHKEVVRSLMAAGANIQAQAYGGETSLFAAACRGHADTVELLLGAGAQVDVPAHSGLTPLCAAAATGSLNTVELLLKHGAHTDVVTDWGERPLHFAADGGNEAIVRAFLRTGIEADPTDKDGKSPMHMAARAGNAAVIRLLLEAGADPTREDEEGRTPLHYAAQASDSKAVAALVERKIDVNAKDYKGKTPLHIAVESKELADNSLRLLLASGADVNRKDFSGSSPLHVAAMSMRADLVAFLLEHGADVSSVDDFGRTPLHRVMERPRSNDAQKIAQMLIRKGADVNGRDVDGDTALHLAAAGGAALMVELLIEKGANVNARNEEGTTPLLAAIQKGQLATVRVLLDSGADPNIRDNAGRGAVYYAVSLGHGGLVDLLKEHGVQE